MYGPQQMRRVCTSGVSGAPPRQTVPVERIRFATAAALLGGTENGRCPQGRLRATSAKRPGFNVPPPTPQVPGKTVVTPEDHTWDYTDKQSEYRDSYIATLLRK
ncbi:hypothetical protein MRX96_014503 [Rhipicephalus microplus]